MFRRFGKRNGTNRSDRANGRPRPPLQSVSHLFHGIAIEPGETACEAVKAMRDRRFLSDEAPLLPLEGCTCGDACGCVYRHFADRRTDTRREADLGLPARPVSDDLRAGMGRRVTDG